jgi:hypothetical protein
MITSVWEADDAALLEEMLRFYPSVSPEPILDATYNVGRFWRGSGRIVKTMDITPVVPVDYECDNREMTDVPDAAFGCVVYDPPHIHDVGNKTVKGFDSLYGCRDTTNKSTGYNLSFLYPGFLAQAYRVLRSDGLLLAKISDQVSNHRSRWAHVDFVLMAQAAGFTVCDMIVKVRRGPMMSSKWKMMHHARKRHCFWIVCRKSESCE